MSDLQQDNMKTTLQTTLSQSSSVNHNSVIKEHRKIKNNGFSVANKNINYLLSNQVIGVSQADVPLQKELSSNAEISQNFSSSATSVSCQNSSSSQSINYTTINQPIQSNYDSFNSHFHKNCKTDELNENDASVKYSSEETINSFAISLSLSPNSSSNKKSFTSFDFTKNDTKTKKSSDLSKVNSSNEQSIQENRKVVNEEIPESVQKQVSYAVYESELQMPDIMQLITKDLSEPYSIYTYRYFIHNWPNLCFLAMSGEECVGSIVCKLDFHKKVKRGYIAMLAVKKEFRRMGIGSHLVRLAIEAMIKDDCDEVVLETEITNHKALNLYENLGFVRDKRLFRYYLNGVDALRLKLWLR